MIIKKRTLFITAIIFFQLTIIITDISAIPESCSYTWTAQYSGTTNLFQSIKAVSDMICWAAGNNATVRRTTDGGLTWINANPNPGVINGNVINIEALDGSNAWATSHLTNLVSYIYKTTNGGIEWVQVYSISQLFINGVHMTSLMNGFAFGDPVSAIWNILTTTNGGLNWSQLPTAPPGQPPAQGFRNSFQVSPPYIWFGSYPAIIMRSSDNGATWSQHSVPGNGMATIMSIHFNSQNLGFASSINMVKSTDAGISYAQHTVPGLGNINSIDGSGTDLWYVRGQYIYHSSDSGNNWTQVFDAGITQSDIDIPDSQTGCLTGWAAGYGGTITKLTAQIVGLNNNNSIPDNFALEQNYPNPFNPSTTITYTIPKSEHVILSIHDITGKFIKLLVNNYREAGTYSIDTDASQLSAGIYIYKIKAGNFTSARKMVLVK